MVALRGFYSLKNTSTPVWAAAISFVVNLALSIILMEWLSTVGLALASNVAVLAQAVFLQVSLTRRLPGLGFAPVLPTLAKIILASAIMGLAVWGGARLVNAVDVAPRLRDWIVVAGLIPAACALYAGLLWMLRIEGREELGALWAKFRTKLKPGRP
jgi:putative peptidoglycan lipid II flippase